MSDDLDDHDAQLSEILRRAVPEGAEVMGRADAVVRRGRRDNRRRGAAGVLTVGVVALAVFLSPNILDTLASPSDPASGSELPASCPRHLYPLPPGSPPWTSLDLARAEVCVYPDDGRVTGPFDLPSRSTPDGWVRRARCLPGMPPRLPLCHAGLPGTGGISVACQANTLGQAAGQRAAYTTIETPM